MDSETARERSALFVATLTSFMGPFMISSVNVALPAIQGDLAMSAVQLGWVSTAYLLATAVVLVPAGKIADIHGLKKIFCLGLIVFTLASGAAVFAGSAAWLIGLRAMQGAGTAMTVTTGTAILTSVFPPAKRGRVMGIYVAAVYSGLSAGPFVGGFMTQYLGWRWLFSMVIPLGIVSFFAAKRYLKGEWAEAQGEKLDLTGSVLYGAATLTFIYGATILPSPRAWGLVLFALVAITVFVWYEHRITMPVFDVTLFATNRAFAFSSLAALIHYAATFALTFMLSLFLQYLKGMPPRSAGSLLVVQPIVMALCSPLAGRMADRIEPRYLASAGMALTALGLAGFALLSPQTPLVLIGANLVLLGFGFSIFSSPNMSAIMGSVQKRHYGIAAGAVATMRLIGQMISMAAATLVLSLYLGSRSIEPSTYPLLLDSMKTVMSSFSIICFVGIYFSLRRGKILE
ncbi:MAG: MFS transporter [Desulfobacteraceae bacterium]